VLEAIIAEIQRQPFKTKVIQSPNVVITTTRLEMVVAPKTNVVRSGILIRSTTNLGNGFDAPPSSLMDSTTSPKMKTMKRKGVRSPSLACNTLRVERHV